MNEQESKEADMEIRRASESTDKGQSIKDRIEMMWGMLGEIAVNKGTVKGLQKSKARPLCGEK